MTLEIFLLLCILIVALVFFSFEWLAVDITALGVLLVLIMLKLLPLEQAFAGFGSDTVVLLLGLLILTAALMQTGVVEIVGRALLRFTDGDSRHLLVVMMLAAGFLSAFISNTAAAAFFLPIILGLTRRANLSPSRFLLPLAFATILASSVTLVGTSTNIVVSGLLSQFGLPPIRMFELTPVGLPILIIGFVYMATIGHRLIVERSQPETLTNGFDLRPYLAEVLIGTKSTFLGKTLAQVGMGNNLDLTVLAVSRDGKRYLSPSVDTVLRAGDALLVEGPHQAILKIRGTAGIDIRTDVEFSNLDLQTDALRLAEVVLLPRSRLIGRTLKGLRVRQKYQIQVLAICRHTGTIRRRISHVPLRMGDVLLVQGHQEHIVALQAENAFDVLGVVEEQSSRRGRAPLAISIFVGMLLLSSLNLLSLPVAMLLGAFLVFVTRCITPEEAYCQVEWKVLILIACMLGLGAAMAHTGTAEFLACQLAIAVGNWNPLWLLTAFFVLTVILTQPMSNQAAAAVVVPVALQMAVQLNLNPRTFAVMIAVAASTSFLTPLEPACLMVYGPGRYRFRDFLRVGAPLTIVVYLIAISLVPVFWPLH